jgi:protein-tyrosine phosphatase
MTTHTTSPKLLLTSEMPSLPGLSVPAQFYLVTREPAPLAGMPYPSVNTPWRALYELGLRHVVSLQGDPARPYDPAPLATLSAVHLQDLYNGASPDNPQWEADLIATVVRVARDALQAEEGVLVHCAGGTGRTGTLIGCLLTSLGTPAQTVISYLDNLNKERGLHGWPESPWQAEIIQRYSTG